MTLCDGRDTRDTAVGCGVITLLGSGRQVNVAAGTCIVLLQIRLVPRWVRFVLGARAAPQN